MNEEPENIFTDAMLIHSYSRAAALRDGELVDVTETAKEAGFTFPTAVTRTVWQDCVAWSEEDSKRQTFQNESGRLWDVLWMASLAARRNPNKDRVVYEIVRVPRGGKGRTPRKVQLILHVGPGDTPEPVITIMLPGDD